MHLGVLLPHLATSVDPITVAAAARSADQLGYHSVWAVDPALAPDRIDGADGFDAVAAIALATRSTDRVGLGLHLPIATARAVLGDESFDDVDVARLSLVVDIGFESGPIARADERTGDESAIREVVLAGRPRLLLVSSTRPTLVGRAALVDGWFATRPPLGTIRTTWASILDDASAAGRDPSTLSLFVRADIGLTERPLSRHRSAFHGSIEQVVDDLLAVQELGAHAAVLAFGATCGLDESLGGYAAIAEGLELRSRS